jgi:membrane-bound inhibitor of C-type lysozyme
VKGFIVVCGLCVLGLFVVGCGETAEQAEPTVQPEQTQQTSDEQPAYTLSADEFSAAYDDDSEAADAEYAGKVIALTGVISDSGTDAAGNPYIVVGEGPSALSGVQCMFTPDDETQLSGLKEGQSVSVQGKAETYVVIPLLSGCSVQ